MNPSDPVTTVTFAHESEAHFARLLDFYDIEWVYEPKSFAIEFDTDGAPTGYFTPDFYLPSEDVYLEITTMNQRLVTKKNRKVRLLRELYPEVRCKIFYQNDFLHLLVKYGLAEPEVARVNAGPPQIRNLGVSAG